jgi:hypothetical protein
MKKILLFLFLIAIIFLGIYIVKTKMAKNLATIPTTTSTTLVTDKVSITNETIKEEKDNYLVNVNYPKTNNSFVNADIQTLIQAKINGFKTAISEPSPISSTMTFNINYAVIFNQNNILSLKFESESYTGGAHPGHIIFTKNYNTKDNIEITFEQVVINETILQTLSEFAIDYFKNQKLEFELSLEGLEPKAENYQTFALAEDGVVFYFNEYQIAPYVAGSFELKVPYQLLEIESLE